MRPGTKSVTIAVLGSLSLSVLAIVVWELSVHRAAPDEFEQRAQVTKMSA